MEALRIWTKLAESGDYLAQQGIGVLYSNGFKNLKPNYEKAFFWLSKCSILVSCQLKLAGLYEEGHGTKKDAVHAAELYRQVLASTFDWPEGKNKASVKLGRLYFSRALGQENQKEALPLFLAAANAGLAEAQLWSGVALTASNRTQSPEDLVEADKWFLLAKMSDDLVSKLMAENFSKELEEKMTHEEMDKAKSLASAWRPSR